MGGATFKGLIAGVLWGLATSAFLFVILSLNSPLPPSASPSDQQAEVAPRPGAGDRLASAELDLPAGSEFNRPPAPAEPILPSLGGSPAQNTSPSLLSTPDPVEPADADTSPSLAPGVLPRLAQSLLEQSAPELGLPSGSLAFNPSDPTRSDPAPLVPLSMPDRDATNVPEPPDAPAGLGPVASPTAPASLAGGGFDPVPPVRPEAAPSATLEAAAPLPPIPSFAGLDPEIAADAAARPDLRAQLSPAAPPRPATGPNIPVPRATTAGRTAVTEPQAPTLPAAEPAPQAPEAVPERAVAAAEPHQSADLTAPVRMPVLPPARATLNTPEDLSEPLDAPPALAAEPLPVAEAERPDDTLVLAELEAPRAPSPIDVLAAPAQAAEAVLSPGLPQPLAQASNPGNSETSSLDTPSLDAAPEAAPIDLAEPASAPVTAVTDAPEPDSAPEPGSPPADPPTLELAQAAPPPPPLPPPLPRRPPAPAPTDLAEPPSAPNAPVTGAPELGRSSANSPTQDLRQIAPPPPPLQGRTPLPAVGDDAEPEQDAQASAAADPADPPNVARLPRIGTSLLRPDAPETAPETPTEETAEANEAAPALERYAAVFAAEPGRPFLGLVLVDRSETPLDLGDLGMRVSIAIDPGRPDAAARASAYREAGAEVLIYTGDFGEDFTESLAAASRDLNESVAFLAGAEGRVQRDRAAQAAVLSEMAASGRGLIVHPSGLNAANREATRQGLASAVLDRAAPEGTDLSAWLDRAAFEASRRGGTIVALSADGATLDTLQAWSMTDRGTLVTVAPVSALLGR